MLQAWTGERPRRRASSSNSSLSALSQNGERCHGEKHDRSWLRNHLDSDGRRCSDPGQAKYGRAAAILHETAITLLVAPLKATEAKADWNRGQGTGGGIDFSQSEEGEVSAG